MAQDWWDTTVQQSPQTEPSFAQPTQAQWWDTGQPSTQTQSYWDTPAVPVWTPPSVSQPATSQWDTSNQTLSEPSLFDKAWNFTTQAANMAAFTGLPGALSNLGQQVSTFAAWGKQQQPDTLTGDIKAGVGWLAQKTGAEQGGMAIQEFMDTLNTMNQWKNGVLSQGPNETVIDAAKRGAATDLTWHGMLEQNRMTGGPEWLQAVGNAVMGPQDSSQMASYDPRRVLRAAGEYLDPTNPATIADKSGGFWDFQPQTMDINGIPVKPMGSQGPVVPMATPRQAVASGTGLLGDVITDPANIAIPAAMEYGVTPVLKAMWNGIDITLPWTKQMVGGTTQFTATARDVIENVNTTTAKLVDDVANAVKYGDNVDYHVSNLVQHTNDLALPEQIKQVADAGGDVKDFLLRKINDPKGVVGPESDPPLVGMSDIPIMRHQQTGDPMEWTPRGGQFNEVVTANEKSSYARNYDSVGGENKFVRYFSPQKPLIVSDSLAAPGALDKLQQADLVPDFIKQSLIPGEALKSAASDMNPLASVDAQAPWRSTKGWQWLQQMLPPEEMGKLDQYVATTKPMEKMSVVEDRLAAELARQNGYDSIISTSAKTTFDPVTHAPTGFQKTPYEVFIVNPDNVPKAIPDVFFQPPTPPTAEYQSLKIPGIKQGLAKVAENVPEFKGLAQAFVQDAYASQEVKDFHDLIAKPAEASYSSDMVRLDESLHKLDTQIVDLTKRTPGMSIEDGRRLALEMQVAKVPEVKAAEMAVKLATNDPTWKLSNRANTEELQAVFDLAKAGDPAEVSRITQALADNNIKPLDEGWMKIALEAKQLALTRPAEERAAGLATPDLIDPTVDYALYRRTKEAEQVAVQRYKGQGFGYKYNARHASQLERELPRGLSPEATNEFFAAKPNERSSVLIKNGYQWEDAKAVADKWKDQAPVKQFLVTDPIELTRIREMRKSRAIADMTVINAGDAAYGRDAIPPREAVTPPIVNRGTGFAGEFAAGGGTPGEQFGAQPNIPAYRDAAGNELALGHPVLPRAEAIAPQPYTAEEIKAFVDRGYAPPDWVKLRIADSQDPRLAEVVKKFANRRYPPDIAEAMNAAQQFDVTPHAYDRFMYYAQKFNSLWKPLAMNTTVGRIVRNQGGNVWNSILQGIWHPKYYVMGKDLKDGLMVETQMIGNRAYGADFLKKMSKALGVDNGFWTADAHEFYLQQGGKVGAFQIPVIGNWMRKINHANAYVEDVSRLANWLGNMDKINPATGLGMTPIEAMMHTKLALFDYLTGLTDFERDFMRTLFPFYTWTRFNAPYQIQRFFGNPTPFVRLANLLNIAEDKKAKAMLNGREERLAPWMADNWPFPVGVGTDGNPMVRMLGFDLPAADLQYALRPGSIPEKGLQLLTPMLSRTGAAVFNYDPFFNRQIRNPDNPVETAKMFNFINMDPTTAYMLKGIPPLAYLDSALSNPVTFGQHPPEEQAAMWKALKRMFGMQTYPVDPEMVDQKTKQLMDRQYRLLKGYARRGDWTNFNNLEKYMNETYGMQLQQPNEGE